MLEGGAADKVVALLPFLLLDNEKRIFLQFKAIDKTFIQPHVGNAASREIHVSAYTNLYLSFSEVSESKRLDNLI